MGSGTFNPDTFYKGSSTSTNRSTGGNTNTAPPAPTFSRQMRPEMNPLSIAIRQSLASGEHPDPTTVLIGCDVTGSMGDIPKRLVSRTQPGALPTVFENLEKNGVSHPQLAFAAVGDSKSDRAPLQVGQFESDNRCADQLGSIFIEGRGGMYGEESYHLLWYFAATKTELSSWTQGKKGIIITIGDEQVHPTLTSREIKTFINAQYEGPDLTNQVILETVRKQWVVCHVFVQTRNNQNNYDHWCDLLGSEHVASVSKVEDVANAISELVVCATPELHTMPIPESSFMEGVKTAGEQQACDPIPLSYELLQELTEAVQTLEDKLNQALTAGVSQQAREQAQQELTVINALLEKTPFTPQSLSALITTLSLEHPSWQTSTFGSSRAKALYDKVHNQVCPVQEELKENTSLTAPQCVLS